MLLLQGDARAPVCSHIIRSPTGSLVPRTRARYWVGTTTREAGFDANVTVASIMDILANHVRLLPALAATSLVYARAGLRPRTSDNKPVVGWVRPGLLYATGHGSKGILYAAFFNLGQS
jgi:glycine oxidase